MNPTRPRRVDKSLFLDTLKELFEGNQALFAGLAVEPLSDWNKTCPVIRLSLGAGVWHSRAELDDLLEGQWLDFELKICFMPFMPASRTTGIAKTNCRSQIHRDNCHHVNST